MFRLLLLAYVPNTQHIPQTTMKLQFGINLDTLRFISPNNITDVMQTNIW